MWSCDSTTYGNGCIRRCMCHLATLPCLCTCSMSQWYNNVLPNSTNLLTYHGTPQNSTYGFSNSTNPVYQESSQQMATNEYDSWLLPNSDNYLSHKYQMKPQGIHVNYFGEFGQSSREGLVEQQHQQEQQISKFSQGIQHGFSLPGLSHVSLPPIDPAGILPEATIGNMDLPIEWTPNEYSYLPPRPVNIIEVVGSLSNSTSISSEGTSQQLISRNASTKPFSYAPMSRQDRIHRYIEKKKTRKYANKRIYSSRKMYAQIRPRIRGRFAKTSQTDV